MLSHLKIAQKWKEPWRENIFDDKLGNPSAEERVMENPIILNHLSSCAPFLIWEQGLLLSGPQSGALSIIVS